MKVRVNAKGQITIPAGLRRKYGIVAGTKLILTEDNEGILLRPVTPRYIRSLRGSLKGGGALQYLEEERNHEKGL